VQCDSRASDRRRTAVFIARRFDQPEVRDRVRAALHGRRRRIPAAVLLMMPDKETWFAEDTWVLLPILACGKSETRVFTIDTNWRDR
jgi:hypothetical protein